NPLFKRVLAEINFNIKIMKLEIEKKCNLTKQDYKIIKEKTKFIEEVEIKDYYIDKDLVLAKHNYYLRLRN
ncbi:MAG: hypothetical protein U9N34_08665, partial [Candidatus Cloacimonadota bacterium]|nr:hypothetical protein [Candidatus Cloacimonadota bacterium]